MRTALYGGDDATDLDAFDALESLVAAGDLDAAVKVGVRSDEGPARDRRPCRPGRGRRARLHRRPGRAGRVRFVDFLRASVLLFAGAATALAVVSIAGVRRTPTPTRRWSSPLAWWTLAAVAGLWLGRRMAPTPGIERLLASARATNTLPEVEPGTVIVTRLWPLGVGTVVTGGIAFLVPQPAAIAAGYALAVALTWRRQSSAVQAIEDRDGVRFHVDKSSPFGAPKLVRTPWARKIERRRRLPAFRSFLSCAQVRVLATSSLVSQARRAVATP